MSDFFTQPVVCSSGPLIALVRAGLAGLLKELFPSVFIPESVAAELIAKDTPDQDLFIKALFSLRVVPLAGTVDAMLATELSSGGVAVIQLARQQKISRVLIDEVKCRRVASIVYQLEVKGTAGLLLEAKKRGLISSVGAALSAMDAGGYLLGPKLRAECLRLADE